jgi:hypothetical protein
MKKAKINGFDAHRRAQFFFEGMGGFLNEVGLNAGKVQQAVEQTQQEKQANQYAGCYVYCLFQGFKRWIKLTLSAVYISVCQ